MRYTIIFFFLLAIAIDSFAQSRFGTMANEIAGLESYAVSLKKAYSATSNGLNTIHDLKNGSMTLNQTYFTSLQSVSPAVRNDPRIPAIGNLQHQVQRVFDDAISWQQSRQWLGTDELANMKSVYSNLLVECNKELQELNMILSDGSVKMTDKQRIDRIDAIYKDMEVKSTFAQSFTHKAYELAVSRNTDRNSDKSIQTLYDLN
jgi:hypothetical protein